MAEDGKDPGFAEEFVSFSESDRRKRLEDPKLHAERAAKWAAENRDAIDAYNRYIEEHGSWAERMGLWPPR